MTQARTIRPPHLGPAVAVQENVGRLEVAVDRVLAMQEGHAGADVSNDPPRLCLGKRLLGPPKHSQEIPVRQQLHDEHHAVRQRRHGPEDDDRVGAAEADHGLKLSQERPALPRLLLLLVLVEGALVVGDV